VKIDNEKAKDVGGLIDIDVFGELLIQKNPLIQYLFTTVSS